MAASPWEFPAYYFSVPFEVFEIDYKRERSLSVQRASVGVSVIKCASERRIRFLNLFLDLFVHKKSFGTDWKRERG